MSIFSHISAKTTIGTLGVIAIGASFWVPKYGPVLLSAGTAAALAGTPPKWLVDLLPESVRPHVAHPDAVTPPKTPPFEPVQLPNDSFSPPDRRDRVDPPPPWTPTP